MKILFVLGFPNPFPGAAWTRIGFFAGAWLKKGHSIEVLGTFSYVTLHKRGATKIGRVNIFNFIFNMGIDHPLVFAINTLMSFIVSTLFLIAKRPNITVVSVPTGDVGLGALLACKLTKTKCVVDYRDRWEDYAVSVAKTRATRTFYYAIKKLMLRIYASSCELVIPVTPGTLSCLRQQGVNNVKLITNGADITVFKPVKKTRKSKDFVIVYVGGATAYYRLDLAIKALKLLSSRNLGNLKLLVVGEIPQIVISDLSNSDVKDKVILLGEISDSRKLAKVIVQSNVGLIPLSVDYVQAKTALPAKFFEYCACSIPVIATVPDDSILAKLIREHEIGLTVSSMDEEKFAEAIYQIYKNESFRETAGKRARALIEEKFDRNKIAEEFLNLLKTSV